MKKNIFKNLNTNSNYRFLAFVLMVIFASSCSKKASDVESLTVPPSEVFSYTTFSVPPIDTTATTAKQIIVNMGGGFDLGNTFDKPTTGYTPNLDTIKSIINLYYNAGMRHVRIPVTWVEGFSVNLADTNGNVDVTNPRLLLIKSVVDYALSKKMYVVINTHHEHWLKDYYDGSNTFNNKFITLWTGIANFFKNEPKQLLFEVLNEPEGKMGQWNRTGFPIPTNATALVLTRRINKIGYEAIRATGGNNSTRVIMIQPNAQGNQTQIEEVYPVKDSLPGGGTYIYLAIQVHNYNPWEFCGQNGSNSAWPGTTAVEDGIKKVGVHSVLLDVPVNYGEFGVGRVSGTERNTDMVRGFYRIFKLTCPTQNMSFTVWDDRGWFGLVTNGLNPAFVNNIVPYMMAP